MSEEVVVAGLGTPDSVEEADGAISLFWPGLCGATKVSTQTSTARP